MYCAYPVPGMGSNSLMYYYNGKSVSAFSLKGEQESVCVCVCGNVLLLLDFVVLRRKVCTASSFLKKSFVCLCVCCRVLPSDMFPLHQKEPRHHQFSLRIPGVQV